MCWTLAQRPGEMKLKHLNTEDDKFDRQCNGTHYQTKIGKTFDLCPNSLTSLALMLEFHKCKKWPAVPVEELQHTVVFINTNIKIKLGCHIFLMPCCKKSKAFLAKIWLLFGQGPKLIKSLKLAKLPKSVQSASFRESCSWQCYWCYWWQSRWYWWRWCQCRCR